MFRIASLFIVLVTLVTPAAADYTSSDSAPFALALFRGYQLPDDHPVAWAESSGYSMYLGEGYHDSSYWGRGVGSSPSFELYLGPLSTGAEISVPFQLDLMYPFLFDSTTLDDTAYENGTDTVTLTIVSRSTYGVGTNLNLTVKTSRGDDTIYEMGNDTFALEREGNHTSIITWSVPLNALAWDYDVEITLSGVLGPVDHITKVVPAAFIGFPLPRATVVDAQNQFLSLWSITDLDYDCGLKIAGLIPYMGGATQLYSFQTAMMQAVEEARGEGSLLSRLGRAFTIYRDGTMEFMGAVLGDILPLINPVLGIPKAIQVISDFRSAIGVADKCQNKSLSQELFGGANKQSTNSFVDSLLTWSLETRDSSSVVPADVLFYEGYGTASVESRGGWARADSTQLFSAFLTEVDSLHGGVYLLSDVRLLSEPEGSNPLNEATIRFLSEDSQILQLGRLHRDGEGTLQLKRYPPIQVSNGSVLSLHVATNMEDESIHVDKNGDGEADSWIYPLGPGVAVDATALPTLTRLYQNAPNPFNPATSIEFSLRAPSDVELDVFDTHGRRVRRLVHGLMLPGRHTIIWRGLDDTGHRVSSGVYHYRLVTGDYEETHSMVLLK